MKKTKYNKIDQKVWIELVLVYIVKVVLTVKIIFLLAGLIQKQFVGTDFTDLTQWQQNIFFTLYSTFGTDEQM